MSVPTAIACPECDEPLRQHSTPGPRGSRVIWNECAGCGWHDDPDVDC